MSGTLASRETRTPAAWHRRGPLQSLRDEMEHLFSEFLGEGTPTWSLEKFTPTLDLAETPTAVEVRMDVPGIKPADIDIQLVGDVLTVCGKTKDEKEEQGKTYHRVERRTGEFSRSATLPCCVKADAVDAQYKDGVLTISLPKTEESKPCKIKVKG